MKQLTIAILSVSLLAACGGGAAPAPPPPSSASIEYISSWAAPGSQPNQQDAPLILVDQQFLDPANGGYLLALSASPSLPKSVSVTWTSSNPAVAPLETQQPFTPNLPDYPAPTAPPDDMYTQYGSAYGASVITASAGAPASVSATIMAIHYHSLSLGCGFRFEPAFAFDPDRATLMQNWANWTQADLYDTAPPNRLGMLDPCLNSPLATGTSELWHMPYGGVLLPATSLQDFAAVTAKRWTNAGTSFSPTSPAVALFKTEEGRIVKALLPVGPYEVSDTSGAFPY